MPVEEAAAEHLTQAGEHDEPETETSVGREEPAEPGPIEAIRVAREAAPTESENPESEKPGRTQREIELEARLARFEKSEAAQEAIRQEEESRRKAEREQAEADKELIGLESEMNRHLAAGNGREALRAMTEYATVQAKKRLMDEVQTAAVQSRQAEEKQKELTTLFLNDPKLKDYRDERLARWASAAVLQGTPVDLIQLALPEAKRRLEAYDQQNGRPAAAASAESTARRRAQMEEPTGGPPPKKTDNKENDTMVAFLGSFRGKRPGTK